MLEKTTTKWGVPDLDCHPLQMRKLLKQFPPIRHCLLQVRVVRVLVLMRYAMETALTHIVGHILAPTVQNDPVGLGVCTCPG